MNTADEENYRTWNKLAARYEDHFMDLDLYTASYERFCALLPPGKISLLEVGCGPGNITRHLLALRSDAEILATDFSETMIARARENNPKAHCKVLDARQIHTLEGKFHGIVSGFVLPYLAPDDCARFLHACMDLLLDDGLLYLSFVPGDPALSGYMYGSTGDRCYFHYYASSTLEEILAPYFIVEEALELPYHKPDGSEEIHAVWIARKIPGATAQ
jgi:ubiquinone/menaquinone biosynthesis C-methylase UbiE